MEAPDPNATHLALAGLWNAIRPGVVFLDKMRHFHFHSTTDQF